MRASLLFLSAIAATAAVACGERAAPTEDRFGPAFASQGGGGGAPQRVTSNSSGANVQWTGGDSTSGSWLNGWLSAGHVDSLGNQGTTVNWYVTGCDAAGTCTYSAGYGTLPLSVFTAHANSAHLVFDPADYPGILWMDGDSLGPVDITWDADRSWSSSWSGTYEYQTPSYRMRQRGSSQSAGASATGYAMPWVIPASASGSIGTNRQMEITFYR